MGWGGQHEGVRLSRDVRKLVARLQRLGVAATQQRWGRAGIIRTAWAAWAPAASGSQCPAPPHPPTHLKLRRQEVSEQFWSISRLRS